MVSFGSKLKWGHRIRDNFLKFWVEKITRRSGSATRSRNKVVPLPHFFNDSDYTECRTSAKQVWSNEQVRQSNDCHESHVSHSLSTFCEFCPRGGFQVIEHFACERDLTFRLIGHLAKCPIT